MAPHRTVIDPYTAEAQKFETQTASNLKLKVLSGGVYFGTLYGAPSSMEPLNQRAVSRPFPTGSWSSLLQSYEKELLTSGPDLNPTWTQKNPLF